ncbi:MAG: flagellar basal body rod C-terminal domain-containing protein [Parvularculaceae bacterium]
MNPFDRVSQTVMSGLVAQAQRMQVAGENLANADTHGYRRKLVSFENIFDRAADVTRVSASRVALDASPLAERFDPGHPLADERGYVAGSNVNAITEFADVREANRSYEAGLQILKQSRDMYSALLEILRR